MESLRQCGACSREMPFDSRVCPYCATPIDIDLGRTGETLDQPEWLEHDSDFSEGGIHGRFLPGTRLLERYRIVGLLGRGGMGEVYRADDLELGQSVALKFLPTEALGDRDRLARFRQEVRIARQISHPNVCRVYDIGKVSDQYFLSMEFVDGEDLASELRRLDRPVREKALEMARQLCAGLDAAHKDGILHRDLKPANVMIDGRGRVRITDFGLAGFIEDLEGRHSRAGTPAYMAPEQLVGGRVTPRSDIYSLGLVLFELFSGVRYRDEVSRLSETSGSRPESTDVSLSSLVPDLDPGVERVVAWCLAEDPAQRPRSALAVAAALPGGDPLAAALEAGETPSPEMVAEAGGTGGLAIGTAWALLLSTLALIALGVALTDRVGVARLTLPEKSPLALAEIASAVAREIGYPAQGNRAFGLCSEVSAATDGVSFWSRESPEPLLPFYRVWQGSLTRAGICVSRSGVTPSNPAADVPGMILMRLDRRSRLLEFEAVPAATIAADSEPRETDYAVLFQAAGVEPGELRRVPPNRTPQHFADRLDAWELESAGSTPTRLEASSVNGRPASFHVLAPGVQSGPTGGSGSSSEPVDTTPIVLVTYYVGFFGSVLLGVHNLRRGRADKRGAIRLAVFVFALKILKWIFTAGHLPLLAFGRLDLALLPLGDALQSAVRYWFFYVAIEPYARRLWPRCLIAWSRALMGRLRDPLVGRALLIGALFGSAWFAVSRLAVLIATALGTPPDLRVAGLWLRQVVAPLAGLIHQPIDAIFTALWASTVLMLLLVVLRNKWVAVTITILLWTAMLALPTNHWIYWLIWAAACASSIYLVGRVGLLALVGAFFVHFALSRFPVTLDPSVWYLESSLTPVVASVALALYAFHTALGGQPLFRDTPVRSPA